jgi:opacity protein-like surface antigen
VEEKMKRIVISVLMSAIVTTGAMAESDLGFKDVGAAVGFVSPDNLDGTFSIGVSVDHGNVTRNIGLESRLDYWGQSESAFGAEASVRDIAIGTRGKYFFELTNPKLRPFAGAGLGIHFLHSEATVSMPGFPETTVDDSATKLGLDLGGGMAAAVGPKTSLLGELWYTAVSDVSQFSLRFGMSYSLQ